MSLTRKGRKNPAGAAARRGSKLSAETRAKISAAAKAQWMRARLQKELDSLVGTPELVGK